MGWAGPAQARWPGEGGPTPRIVAAAFALILCAVGVPARANGPAAAAGPGLTAEPAAAAGPEAPSVPSRIGPTLLVVGLCEGLFLGYSALAAGHPQEVGWTMVAFTPIAAGSGGTGNLATHFTVVGLGAGLGLYDALVLKSDRYSRQQRFWQNMAGWHLIVAATGVVGWATAEGGAGAGPGPSSPPAAEAPPVSLGLGLTAGGPAIVVGGRF